MFVFSVSSKTLKYVLAVVAVLGLAGTIFTASRVHLKRLNAKPVESDNSSISFKASNSKERLKFISQFGWEVETEPSEVAEIIIPIEFDDVYSNYNEIQKQQSCDLTDYCGKRVKRWTYTIKNYPGYNEDDTCVRINLLIYDGIVIGGDVSSTELSGFMHTFYKSE